MLFGKRLCPVCGSPADEPDKPCHKCRLAMIYSAGDTCSSCGLDLAGAENPCPACRESGVLIDGIVVLGPWAGPLREWLSMMKYGEDTRLVKWPAHELLQLLEQRWPGVPIVPVPPRPLKIFRKGFDAIDLLTSEMARQDRTVLKLLRRRGQKTQKQLNRRERMEGRALSFELRSLRRALPDSVVLIDDVLTTGATLKACAGVLKRGGVRMVSAGVICRD